MAELDGKSGNALIRSYTWSRDISGTRSGAAGIGGLVLIYDAASEESYYPIYDPQHNIIGLVEADSGKVAARYEYGPFGEIIRVSGDAIAKEQPIGFSTKYTDRESGLVYYGYRYYQPLYARWLSRDPLGVNGGMNVYGFVGNNPLMFVDPLGLDFCEGFWEALKEPAAMAADLATLSAIAGHNLFNDDKIYAEDMVFESGTFSGLTHTVIDGTPVKKVYGEILKTGYADAITLGQYSTQLASWENYWNHHYGLIDEEAYLDREGTIYGRFAGGLAWAGATALSHPDIRSGLQNGLNRAIDKGRDSIARIKNLGKEDCLATNAGPKYTFRGDTRSPETIFEEGFTARGSSTDLFDHAVNNKRPPSAYIPTSKSAEVAADFVADQIYVVRPRGGIDVNDVLGTLSPIPEELEIAVPWKISPSDIRGVTLPKQGISLLNPNYKP